MIIDPDKLARAAVAKYGTDAQWDQLQEEAAEVIVAVSHYRRGRVGSRHELLAELADLVIMIAQAREMLGADAFDETLDTLADKLAVRLGVEP
jgi:NTP pyrophosphatase (non-canonical NTP hydrolase)